MQLDKINFEKKKVVDIGCAGGFFTRYARNKGACRVTGFDAEKPIHAAKNLANMLGYFNVDYDAVDLRENKWQINDADIVFFLSMNFHIGIPEQLKHAKTLIFEDNGEESRSKNQLEPSNQTKGGNVAKLLEWFNHVEFVGRGEDHGNKAVYHLWK